jgi:stearoyl-CoA desaturase (delta-9 desaturase)
MSIWPILTLFVAHWVLSVFAQTFFLHRYSAHRMFTMSKGWERFFYLFTWFTQGSSFLNPRAYAILHREHHAFSDTERDPHSPHIYPNFFDMMLKTKQRYHGLAVRELETEPRFEGGYPEWAFVDRWADSWVSRIGFGTAYALFYLAFAPHWAFYFLLPVHWLMGPIHGAIVNWGGHKYGYRNFATTDKSKNTLIFDFLTWGELFQNNHHKFGMAPNFAVRWFELDPSYQVMRVFRALGIIHMENPQKTSWSPADKVAKGEPLPAETPMGPPMLADAE